MAKRKRRLKKSVKRFLYLLIGIVVLVCIFSNNKTVSHIEEKIENITLKQEEMFKTDKYYMALDSSMTFDATKIEISDNDILSLDNNTIKAIKVGNSKIKVIKDNKYDELEIIVTDIISNYNINKKDKLKCKQYSDEEEKLLEDILANQIEFYGYKTRAGVVAAERFVTLPEEA